MSEKKAEIKKKCNCIITVNTVYGNVIWEKIACTLMNDLLRAVYIKEKLDMKKEM